MNSCPIVHFTGLGTGVLHIELVIIVEGTGVLHNC